MHIPLTRVSFLLLAVSGALLAQQAKPELDYAFFKERVQPIFLQKRLGHARCVSCHTGRVPPLQELSPSATTWDEAQSRQNFAIWSLYVTPGEPMKSKFLTHPLARDAGGDSFHGGGKHWASTGDPEWQTIAAWVRGQKLDGPALPEATGVPYVIQTNSAGDNVHVIDPATNRVAGLIQGISTPHGVVIAPDGKRIYITNETDISLDVVDAKTLKVFKRIPLSADPNNLDVAKDGSKVYVGINGAPGGVDIIDAKTLTNVKTMPTSGRIHNVYVTPDGKYLVAGSIPGKTIDIFDLSKEEKVSTINETAGVRTMTFIKNADGSTKWLIIQLSDFHGVVVIDFAARQEVKRVAFPDPPGVEKELEGLQGSPAHGLAVSPDQKVLWSTSKYYGSLYAYAPPESCRAGSSSADESGCEWKLLKIVPVGSHPDWLTIIPDGSRIYAALAGDDETAAVDTKTMTLVGKIPVGNVPKRIVAGMLNTK